jgi:hypothetical protein
MPRGVNPWVYSELRSGVTNRIGARPEEGTRGIIEADRPITANNVRATQEFLKKQGYAIPVDGRMGPLTKSALSDWHKGKRFRNPQAWTAKLVKTHDPNRDNHGVNDNNQRNQPARSTSNNLKPKNNRAGINPAGNFSSSGDGYLSNELNPDVFSSAMAEAEYGPILAELQREERRIREGGPQRVADIDRIYSDLQTRIGQRTAANRTTNERLQASTTGAAASLASALGLGAADPSVLATLGASTGIERDYLRDVAAADERLGADLGVAAGAEEAAQKVAVNADIEEALRTISSERAKAQGARSSDTQKYRMQALELQEKLRSDRLKDKIALFNAELAASMAPVEMKRALQQLRAGNVGIQLDEARLDQMLNPPPPPPSRRNFGQLAPDEKLTLQDSILTRVNALPQGAGVNRKVALINSMLRAAGYNPLRNNAAKQFAFDTARAAGINPSRRWWGGR